MTDIIHAIDPARDFDRQAQETIVRLCETFGLAHPIERGLPGRVPMGLEVEVPWSSYFPELWDRYGLASRKVYSLPQSELEQLGVECARIEDTLLPRLQATVACGIPRGNDRYWEFAFRPTFNASLVVDQIELLTAAGLLPRDKRHALQVTVGGIPPCKSLYKLCMLLEVEFVDPARIRSGIDQMSNTIHTGWCRKGRAGVHAKASDELQGGEQVASELRLLQLPTAKEDLERMLDITQFGVNAIQDLRDGLDSKAARAWTDFEHLTQDVLASHGLPDENWFAGGPGGGINHDAWHRFSDRLGLIRGDLQRLAPIEVLEPAANRSSNKSNCAIHC